MIILPRPGQRPTDLVRHLVELAGGDHTAVRTSHGGFRVTDHVAAAYLAADTPTPPPVPRVTVPPAVVAAVGTAETVGGLRRPVDPPPDTASTRPRTRAVRARSSEEHSHG